MRDFFSKHSQLIIGGLVLVCIGAVAGYLLSRSSLGTLPYLEQNTGTSATSEPQKPPEPTENFTLTSNVISANPKSLTVQANDVPPATSFKSFQYDASVGKVISVSGTCSDAYYALLIFKSTVDYRAHPDASMFNKAFPCSASRTFTLRADMRDSNLPSGSYYIFVADEGTSGWYNPR